MANGLESERAVTERGHDDDRRRRILIWVRWFWRKERYEEALYGEAFTVGRTARRSLHCNNHLELSLNGGAQWRRDTGDLWWMCDSTRGERESTTCARPLWGIDYMWWRRGIVWLEWEEEEEIVFLEIGEKIGKLGKKEGFFFFFRKLRKEKYLRICITWRLKNVK